MEKTSKLPIWSSNILNYVTCNDQHCWMCVIDDEFVDSSVSYYGLSQYIEFYKYAVDIIRRKEFSIANFSEEARLKLIENTKKLYGMLHSRFILTEEGVAKMKRKYDRECFGICPRMNCEGEKLIPIGFSNIPGIERAKCYCPRCHDVYNSDKEYDAAFFGPDFPFMFLKMYEIPFDLDFYPFYLDSEDNKQTHRLMRAGERE